MDTVFPDTQPLATIDLDDGCGSRAYVGLWSYHDGDGNLVFMVEARIDEAPLTADHARRLAAARLDAADRLVSEDGSRRDGRVNGARSANESDHLFDAHGLAEQPDSFGHREVNQHL